MENKKKSGFAAMDPEKLRALAALGGKAAHALGVAHKFVAGSEKAREAGRKGGKAPHVSRGRKAPLSVENSEPSAE